MQKYKRQNTIIVPKTNETHFTQKKKSCFKFAINDGKTCSPFTPRDLFIRVNASVIMYGNIVINIKKQEKYEEKYRQMKWKGHSMEWFVRLSSTYPFVDARFFPVVLSMGTSFTVSAAVRAPVEKAQIFEESGCRRWTSGQEKNICISIYVYRFFGFEGDCGRSKESHFVLYRALNTLPYMRIFVGLRLS